jgi:uncharacterized membrane protein affecting hemolysin expression
VIRLALEAAQQGGWKNQINKKPEMVFSGFILGFYRLTFY